MNFTNYHDVFGYISGFLQIVGMFPYVYSIIVTKETKLNRVTWFIWSFMGVINFFAYYSAGERETIWFVIMGAINPTILFLLSLKYGEKLWYRVDVVCLLLAILALVIWKITGNPVLALVIGLIMDALAIVPLCMKISKDPFSENLLGWIIGTVSSFCNLIAVKQWTWANGIYTIYMVCGFLVITAPLVVARIKKKLEENVILK